MRIDINEQAWNQGFWDGDSGKPSLACPYGVESDERLSWMSGYIEGKAFRNGYIATPPGSRVPLRKSALAAELCAVPLCSTAPSSAAQDPRQRGVKIARRSGVNFGSRLTPVADVSSRPPCAAARHTREDWRRVPAQKMAASTVGPQSSSIANAARRSLCFSLRNNARAFLMSRSAPLSASVFRATVVG
jgi:ribosome modulation factor